MISGEQSKAEKAETTLVVSWESLERRKNEYAELVQKAIPANSKEIAVARSYGDLRENHEFKAAKEMQKILMRRKGELEAQLVRARGSDFANPRTDVVSIGDTVAVTDLEHQHAETFTILGAWDSDPERRHHQLPHRRRPGPAQHQARPGNRSPRGRRQAPLPRRIHLPFQTRLSRPLPVSGSRRPGCALSAPNSQDRLDNAIGRDKHGVPSNFAAPPAEVSCSRCD